MDFPVRVDAGMPAQVAADAVHERIRDSILNGDLRPNARLVEGELGAWLSVSRTPVREALLRLAEEGLVSRSRGWVVREHLPEELIKILDARAAAEGAAAAIAATQITAGEIAELRVLIARMDAPDIRRAEVSELNKQFHHTITLASRNDLLVQWAQRTRITYWNFTISSLFSTADSKVANDQHREILASLEAGDAAASERIVRAHITRTRDVLADVLGV